MRIRLFDPSIHPRFDDLPWSLDLSSWTDGRIVEFPVGLHRHVVRFFDYGGQYYVLKELPQRLAEREFRLLRIMNDRGLPVVAAVAVVDDRGGPDPVLITRFLNYALPYRHLFRERSGSDVTAVLVESLAVLLARLHNAGFFWGDASLSNAMFRRDGDHLSAFALDTETGELHERLSAGQRDHDVEIAVVNIAGGLSDIAASGELPDDVDPFEVALRLGETYGETWEQLHGSLVYDRNDSRALEQRLARVHDLGFEVREAVITEGVESGSMVFSPASIDDGHFGRELYRLTGITAREHQARRMLEHIGTLRAELESRHDRVVTLDDAAHHWLTEVFDPVLAAIPAETAGKLERPQLFLEVLDHHSAREWGITRAGDLIDTARFYAAGLLTSREHERNLATEY